MSKIGKLPINIPSGVTISISDDVIVVKGPKGELTAPVHPANTKVEQVETQLLVTRTDETKESKALHGLTRALIQNCIDGVTEGFTKTLEINGVGYRAEMKGTNTITLHIGYSHPVDVPVTEGLEVKTEKNQIIISGIDKQKVGQQAAVIRAHKKPEPYKGKGIKYIDEVIKRKAGKAAKA